MMQRKRRFPILLFLTVVVVVVAFLLVQKDHTPAGDAVLNTPLVPGLAKALDSVTRITVGTPDAPVEIIRQEDGDWRVENLSRYPADIGKVRKILLRLSDSRIREKKTADPSRLGELGLAEEESAILRVRTLKKIPGEEKLLADIRIGNYSDSLKGTYVRNTGQTQAWLASGDLRVEAAPSQWVEASLTDISRNRIKRVEIDHAHGKKIVIVRDKMAEDFVLQGIPRGKAITSHYNVNQLATVFEQLRMEEVRPASDLSGASSLVVTVQTFDGLELYMDFITGEGQVWGRLSATFNAALRGRAADKGPLPESSGPADPKLDVMKESEVVMGETAAITAHTEGWYYRLPPQKLALFGKTFDGLLKDK